MPAGDDRGRARGGQEPSLRGALRRHRRPSRTRHLASGPLPPLRRGDRLLGAGRDRQGRVRHPRVRLARARRRPSSSAPCPPTIPTGPGSRLASPRWSARRRSPPPRRSRSRPGGASWSRWRSLARPCSCSRTCIGPTPPCSPSSSTWPTGRRGCRCSCSARLAPSCTSSTRLWGGRQERERVNLAPLTDEETARLIAALLERAVLPAETQRALLERAGGNPLYAEEFVRLLTDRGQLRGVEREVPGSVQALITARLDTLSPERKSLLQDAAVVGKVFWAGARGRDGRPRARRGRAGLARALAQGARPTLTHLFDAGRGRVRLLAPAGQGRLLRADPPHRPCRPPPRGRRLARAAGGRAGRGPGRRARPPLPERARARPRRRPGGGGGGAGSERDPLPRPGRRSRASARRRPRGAEPGQGAVALPPPATPSGRPCSSAGRMRRSSRAGSRRHGTRSRRRSPCTGSRASRWPLRAC